MEAGSGVSEAVLASAELEECIEDAAVSSLRRAGGAITTAVAGVWCELRTSRKFRAHLGVTSEVGRGEDEVSWLYAETKKGSREGGDAKLGRGRSLRLTIVELEDDSAGGGAVD